MRRPESPGRGRADGAPDWRLMEPERFRETFLADLASRINFVGRLAGRHAEAARFLLDLRKALAGEEPRRA